MKIVEDEEIKLADWDNARKGFFHSGRVPKLGGVTRPAGWYPGGSPLKGACFG